MEKMVVQKPMTEQDVRDQLDVILSSMYLTLRSFGVFGFGVTLNAVRLDKSGEVTDMMRDVVLGFDVVKVKDDATRTFVESNIGDAFISKTPQEVVTEFTQLVNKFPEDSLMRAEVKLVTKT